MNLSGSEGGAAPELARRTMSAAQWRLASSILQGGLQFGVGVLLARLLSPVDFGIVALAFVVVEFATLVADLGVGPALVQRDELSERHLRVAFSLSLLVSVVVAGGVLLAAPLLAGLLRAPALLPVLRAESLLFLFAGLGTVARAMLQRSLDFRRIFWLDLASYGFGYAVVAVSMALLGFGVWALVAGALMQGLLGSVLAVAVVRHPLRLSASRAELRQLLGFGAGVSAVRVLNHLARHGDNLIIGRWLGPAALGLYGRAYHLMTLPLGYLGAVTGSVLFPALSRIQHQPERMRNVYLLGVQLTALLGAPIMAGLVVAAPHLMLGLYGPQWAGATIPFQILAAVGLCMVLYHAAGAVAQATGNVHAEAYRQGVYAVLVLAGAGIGSRYGVTGVAAGVAVAITGMYLMMAQLAVRITGASWRGFVGAHLPGLALAMPVTVVALSVRTGLERQGVGSLWILLAIVAACAATLPAGIYLLPEAVRPRELFARLDGVVVRFPIIVQNPIRRVLRLSPGQAKVSL